ncbi:WYL domain-containing protein [Nocardioides convexus]|uniref:helix-turn-helix transcriptional regulator n=1 Tax=Nocardioides convexus TaxID=2712224 RepID=UPI00241835F9|nr:WYL domain-containing protein [Nocardioides convexus]
MDLDALDIAQPLLTAEEPGFETCWLAVCERMEIAFDYQRPGADAPSRRRVQPWGVVRSTGRWYVVGFDLDRQAERVFRLSRVQGEVRTVGLPGAYDVPPDTDVREIARRLAPPSATEHAVLLVREGAGHGLRRAAARVETGVPGPDVRTRWDRVELVRPAIGLADEVLAHGPDVVLVEPAAVRAQVVDRLRRVVA